MFYNIISLKRLLIALFIRQVLKLLNDYASQIATLKQLHNSIGPTQAGAAMPRPSFSSRIMIRCLSGITLLKGKVSEDQ